MGNALTSTSSERWQALQHLEAAYNQPDGNMFFTYNGHTYRSVRVNPDNTLQVIDQTTGQVMTLDPVSIYSSGMAAAGTPLPPAQSAASNPFAGAETGPSTYSNVTGQVGMYSGMVNMATQIRQVKDFFSHHIFMGQALGALAAFLSASSLFRGIQEMFKTGKITLGGLFNISMAVFGVATGVNAAMLTGSNAAFSATLTNPAGWLVAGAVLSGSVLFGSVSNMFTNGVSPVGVVTAAIATFGTAVLTNLAIQAIAHGISSLAFSAALTGPWGWIAAGAIIAFSLIWAWLHPPPPEQVAAQNLTGALSPVVWVQGPLAVVALGTVAILMGWAKNSTPPAMASLTVPAYYVNQVLAATGVSNIDLKSKTPTVLVEPGDGRVVIVSPNGTDAHGNPLVTLQTYNVSKNLQFVSSPNAPPDGAYIPFFQVINGRLTTKPNPALVNALTIQDKLLLAVLSRTLLTHDALNALNLAAAANKFGVSPNN